MRRRSFDITELYNYLKSENGKYVLSFDMVNLMQINEEHGHEAGDRAIIEALHRIEEASDDSMLAFRIGGDEFVLLTGLTDREQVSALARKILQKNGETVAGNNRKIPVSLRAGAIRLQTETLRYSELYAALAAAARAGGNTDECGFKE